MCIMLISLCVHDYKCLFSVVKLLGSLPKEVLDELKGLECTNRNFNVEEFLKEHLPTGQSTEVLAELRKV